jgi:hypothetical protein
MHCLYTHDIAACSKNAQSRSSFPSCESSASLRRWSLPCVPMLQATGLELLKLLLSLAGGLSSCCELACTHTCLWQPTRVHPGTSYLLRWPFISTLYPSQQAIGFFCVAFSASATTAGMQSTALCYSAVRLARQESVCRISNSFI